MKIQPFNVLFVSSSSRPRLLTQIRSDSYQYSDHIPDIQIHHPRGIQNSVSLDVRKEGNRLIEDFKKKYKDPKEFIDKLSKKINELESSKNTPPHVIQYLKSELRYQTFYYRYQPRFISISL